MVQHALNIVYEDANVLVVNKPAGVLSQPGKTVDGSIATQVRNAYPEATGSLLVHRLDMDTSGLLMLAKTKEAHRNLQQQFEKRAVRKRYCALLDHEPNGGGGRVVLPLRLDIDNRPSQIVCFEHGKASETLWYRANVNANKHETARVFFHPLTGRSHQLRVHAASPLGLNRPIRGDRLYGVADNRMYLHADQLGFYHPETQKPIILTCPAPF